MVLLAMLLGMVGLLLHTRKTAMVTVMVWFGVLQCLAFGTTQQLLLTCSVNAQPLARLLFRFCTRTVAIQVLHLQVIPVYAAQHGAWMLTHAGHMQMIACRPH